MKTHCDDVFFVNEQQLKLILSVDINLETKACDLRELIKKALKMDDASQIAEWLYYDAKDLKEKALLHTIDPVFMSKIYDSSTLLTKGLYVSEYYTKAMNIFIKLGAKKNENKRLRKRPPTCIKGYSSSASNELSSYIRMHNSGLCDFGIVCACGCSDFTVAGVQIVDTPVIFDQITIRCTACDSRINIFNSRYNGYDGVLGHCYQTEQLKADKDNLVDLSCPKCKGSTFQVAVGFEQTVDKDEARDMIREENLKVKPEDLFTWFIGAAQCAECHHIFSFSDIECA